MERSKVSTLGLTTYAIIMLSGRFYKELDVAVMPVWKPSEATGGLQGITMAFLCAFVK